MYRVVFWIGAYGKRHCDLRVFNLESALYWKQEYAERGYSVELVSAKLSCIEAEQ